VKISIADMQLRSNVSLNTYGLEVTGCGKNWIVDMQICSCGATFLGKVTYMQSGSTFLSCGGRIVDNFKKYVSAHLCMKLV
jgi:hypothetical protein